MARRSFIAVFLLIALSACNSGSSAVPTLAGNVPSAQQTPSAASPVAVSTAVPTPVPTPTPNIAATAQAQGCQVTPYSGSGPGRLANYPLYPDWYAGDDLWMAPPDLTGVDPTLPETDQRWYAGQMPLLIATPATSSGALQVSGQLANNSGTSLQVKPGTVSVPPGMQGSDTLHDFDVTFSAPGCWQISVTQGDSHLTATVFVLPASARPYIIRLAEAHQALQPYPVPASCAATDWAGPKDLSAPFSARYWLQGAGTAVGSLYGILWAEAPNTLFVQTQGTEQPQLSGELNSQPSASLRASLVQAVGEFGNGWNATVVFPTDGCWRITVTAGSQPFTATVYVYPADCQHDFGTPVAATCQPPAG